MLKNRLLKLIAEEVLLVSLTDFKKNLYDIKEDVEEAPSEQEYFNTLVQVIKENIKKEVCYGYTRRDAHPENLAILMGAKRRPEGNEMLKQLNDGSDIEGFRQVSSKAQLEELLALLPVANSTAKEKSKKPIAAMPQESATSPDAEVKATAAMLSQREDMQCQKDKKGHYIITESGNMRIIAYGECGRSDFTQSIYVYAERDGRAGKSICLSPYEVSGGGIKFIKFLKNLKGFGEAEVSQANNRLWLLNYGNQIKTDVLETVMNPQEIFDYFIGEITANVASPEQYKFFYCEKMADGRIDIGIWVDKFSTLYEELETDISQREWCKQAKACGWLLPDAGRGGGQHTPGSGRCEKYQKVATDRIQRFVVDAKTAETLYAQHQSMLVQLAHLADSKQINTNLDGEVNA